MDATPPAELHPGQPVRVAGRGHLSRCGTVAFVIADAAGSADEVWIDFGSGAMMPVERCMIEPVAPAGDGGIADPVAGGLAALRTSWPRERPEQPGRTRP